MKLLLVEPDVVLARTYQNSLQAEGHEVLVSITAQTALHTADSARPDVVVLEVQLVSHSGIEFLYEFRSYAEWQSVPVIVLSLVPPTEFKESWEQLRSELGVSDYLYKPHTSLAKLNRAVEAIGAPVV